MYRRSTHHTFLTLTMTIAGALAGCGEQSERWDQAEEPAGTQIEEMRSAVRSAGTGLHADYFNNQDLIEPAALSRNDQTVSFDWASGSPAEGVVASDHFSVRWTGRIEARYTQTYTFYTLTDDGVRLWVDGQPIIDNWTDHGRTEDQGTVALTAGRKVQIRMEFYESTGNALASLAWSSTSQAKEIVPQRQLYPSPTTGGVPSGSGGATATGGTTGSGGATATGGTTGTGGATATGGTTGSGGSSDTGPAPSIPTSCTSPVPAEAQPADVSSPTTVVGNGTAASCTFAALNAAVAKGGVITFACGSSPVTIPVAATMSLRTDVDTVIDGGNRVTLDGQNAVRIFYFYHADFMVNDTRVTLQRLKIVNANSTPTAEIPPAPAPCSQGWNDGEGGAIYMRDGNLTIVDCTFSHNQGAQLGPDTGGGAVYLIASKRGLIVNGSVFTDNSASNAGAIGGLFATEVIYNSLFQNNRASGNGANGDEASMCSYINNGQHEVGSGGNGGAIYQDGGKGTNVFMCGVAILDNAAGGQAFGGGVFMTSNDWTGDMTIRDSIITGNTGRYWSIVQEGTEPGLGTAFGINVKSATVVNSTLQGR